MIIAVASGKGGTGKTTVATSVACVLNNVQLLDCDVEEPNAHIFIKPDMQQKDTVTIPVPKIDETKCTACGRCKKVCLYNAIAVMGQTVLVFDALCHGCGACTYSCPENAIEEIQKEIGIIQKGFGCGVPFVHGYLKIGAAMAPPVIRQVKKEIDSEKTVIIDAPPGTSCPVIAAIKDTDFCLLVTEPTPFGLHDLRLAVDVIRKIGIPYGVIINRATLGDSETEDFCNRENIPILMSIPFDKKIASAYSQGIPIVEAVPSLKKDFGDMVEKIKVIIDKSTKE